MITLSEKSPKVSESKTGLHLHEVSAGYGKLRILMGVSLSVCRGETVALLGANGSGKTTTLRTISGLLTPTSGQISFLGKRIDGLNPGEIVRLGISHAPERRRLFPKMTVLENLEMGAYTMNDKKGTERNLDRMFADFPILGERKNQSAGTLSGGEQQMLCIARSLMSEPKLLIFDEPTLGLSPTMVGEIGKIVQRISSTGTAVLLVEQNAHVALQVASRAYVLEKGRVVTSGPSEKLLQDDTVKKTYLGL